MQRKKVVFFFPAFSSQEATAPLGILAVATPLLRAGYQVKLIDSTITPNFRARVLEELNDALCLAVSLVTGPMIRETVEIAREAKRLYPDKAGRSRWLASVAAARIRRWLPNSSTSSWSARARTRCSKWSGASKPENSQGRSTASATKKTVGSYSTRARAASADSRDAAQGLSSGRFRRL